jgi:hypothetical protein
MCVVNLKSVNKLDLTWKQSFLIYSRFFPSCSAVKRSSFPRRVRKFTPKMFDQINLWFTFSIFLSKINLICCLIYWLDEESFIVYESSGESALFNVDALTSDPIRSSSAEFFYNDTGPYDSAICRFFQQLEVLCWVPFSCILNLFPSASLAIPEFMKLWELKNIFFLKVSEKKKLSYQQP